MEPFSENQTQNNLAITWRGVSRLLCCVKIPLRFILSLSVLVVSLRDSFSYR